MFPDCREKYCETAFKCSVSLQVVINGGATSTGEQDNEDTELMAIYTTENGIAEKVPLPSPPPFPAAAVSGSVQDVFFIWVLSLPCGVGVCVLCIMEIEVMRSGSY